MLLTYIYNEQFDELGNELIAGEGRDLNIHLDNGFGSPPETYDSDCQARN